MKLTDDLMAEITRSLSSGCDLETAARAAGVRASVLAGWNRDGYTAEERGTGKMSKHEQRCLELLEASRTARAENEVKALALVQRAAIGGSWQAATWWLERVLPDKYARAKAHGGERPGAGRPKGSANAPDRILRAVD